MNFDGRIKNAVFRESNSQSKLANLLFMINQVHKTENDKRLSFCRLHELKLRLSLVECFSVISEAIYLLVGHKRKFQTWLLQSPQGCSKSQLQRG